MKPINVKAHGYLSLLLLLLLPLLAGCSRDGVDGEVDMTFTEIVTYEGNRDGGAVFTFRAVDDSPLITLTSTTALDDIDPGSRMLISYTIPGNKPYTSGTVTLGGAARITQGDVITEWDEVYEYWGIDPVWLYSMWRSGDYINLRLRLTYTAEPRIFGLVLDPATADSEWPLLYVTHIISTEVDYHDREYYASFDISAVRSLPGVKGVRVAVNDTNIGQQIFMFPL